jgi:hypothetical protein
MLGTGAATGITRPRNGNNEPYVRPRMDKWEPLIMIADAIGGEYAKHARAAAAGATDDAHHAGDSLSELLLADLRTLFDAAKPRL